MVWKSSIKPWQSIRQHSAWNSLTFVRNHTWNIYLYKIRCPETFDNFCQILYKENAKNRRFDCEKQKRNKGLFVQNKRLADIPIKFRFLMEQSISKSKGNFDTIDECSMIIKKKGMFKWLYVYIC